MTNTTSFFLVPYILAFLLYVLRFYNREGARSMGQPSFLLAMLTVAAAFAYLILGVTDTLPPYGPFVFLGIGVVLAGIAILRMFMI